MAISKQYMKDWQYDPDDPSSHVTRAGLALLPEGIEWRTKKAYKEAFSTKEWKLKSVNSILADAQGTSAPQTSQQPDQVSNAPVGSPAADTTVTGLSDLPDGMVAVDTTGNAVSHLRKAESCVDASARGMKILQAGATAGRAGSLTHRVRTAQLWKTINPGCMPEYTSLPISTAHEAYTLDYSCIPPVDKCVHRKKNDFTEHTEQGASTMKALISDKK